MFICIHNVDMYIIYIYIYQNQARASRAYRLTKLYYILILQIDNGMILRIYITELTYGIVLRTYITD